MPVTCASEPVIGVDSTISSALPAGGPSRISVSTTSASSRSTMRCAVVDPTNPPPTTVTFLRMSAFSCFIQSECRKKTAGDSPQFGQILLGDCRRLHVFDDGAGKLRSAQLGRAFHQALQVVRNSLLADRSFDTQFDQLANLVPAHEFEHHHAR